MAQSFVEGLKLLKKEASYEKINNSSFIFWYALKKKRCDFTDYDIERFLWPYKPQQAITVTEYQRREDEKQFRWEMSGGPVYNRSGMRVQTMGSYIGASGRFRVFKRWWYL